MVKIRLMRMGAKKNPHYRVVVVDARQKRSSAYIESLGYYDPRGTVAEPLRIDVERAQHWLSQGAQPSETAVRLLERAGAEVGKVLAKRAPHVGTASGPANGATNGTANEAQAQQA